MTHPKIQKPIAARESCPSCARARDSGHRPSRPNWAVLHEPSSENWTPYPPRSDQIRWALEDGILPGKTRVAGSA